MAMKLANLLIKPKTKSEKLSCAGANLICDIQFMILDGCTRLGITRGQLARKIGIKKGDIDKIFSDYTIRHINFDNMAYMFEVLEVKLQWKTRRN